MDQKKLIALGSVAVCLAVVFGVGFFGGDGDQPADQTIVAPERTNPLGDRERKPKQRAEREEPIDRRGSRDDDRRSRSKDKEEEEEDAPLNIVDM
jgi:hypothetical protein